MLVARAMERVGNDNGPVPKGQGLNDDVLQAALRHFAEHGLSAGPVARARAQAAHLAADEQSYEWWLAITRTLDRRLAAQVERQTSGCA
jgi:hypothetical protein